MHSLPSMHHPGAADFVRACAAALSSVPRGKAALYIGGEALLEEGVQAETCSYVQLRSVSSKGVSSACACLVMSHDTPFACSHTGMALMPRICGFICVRPLPPHPSCSHTSLYTAGGALHNAGLIAGATGSALLVATSFARMDRGHGLPCPTCLPYFPQEAAA